MTKMTQRRTGQADAIGNATVFVCLSVFVLTTDLSAQPKSSATVAAAFKDPNQEWKDYPTR